MLGASPSSPFRAGSAHRAPWPPPSPAHHASAPQPQDGFGRFGVSGGLYSLFPGSADTSAAIYSQATSTSTRFSHSANTYHSFIGSHKVADSLFTSSYTFGGPTPPPPPAPGPPYSPAGPLVERGITQLEMMAKGFNNNNNNTTTVNNNNSNANNNNLSNGGAVSVGVSGGVAVVSAAAALPAKSKAEGKRRAECEAAAAAAYHHAEMVAAAERGRQAAKQQQQQAQLPPQAAPPPPPPPPQPQPQQQQPPPPLAQQRRWERDPPPLAPPAVKHEMGVRPSCGCRRPGVSASSPAPMSVRPNGCHAAGPEGAAAASLPVPAALGAGAAAGPAPSFAVTPADVAPLPPLALDRKKLDGAGAAAAAAAAAGVAALGGGCSRTIPVALRGANAPPGAAAPAPAALSAPPLDWALQPIKKEPGLPVATTPCQVAEVTTSVSPLVAGAAAVVKLEAVGQPACSVAPALVSAPAPQMPALVSAPGAALAKKEPLQQTQHAPVSAASIPVGIAVARQRAPPPPPPPQHLHVPPPPLVPPPPQTTQAPALPPQEQPPTGGGGGAKQAALALSLAEPRAAPAPAPDAPPCAAAPADLAAAAPAPPGLSAMAVLQPQCEDRVTNGMAPWATAATHNSALTPPTLWQYPGPRVSEEGVYGPNLPVICAEVTHLRPRRATPPVRILQAEGGVSAASVGETLLPAEYVPYVRWDPPEAPVPVQLGPTDHMPLPPVGYQLVRDPITGHLLLIPATNIEHLQRAVLWPSYPATLQPSLHMAAQPTTQHIQLFESTEPSEFLGTLQAAHNHSGPAQGQTARILVQPQLTLTAAEAPLPKRKGTVIKVEATDCSALEVKTPGMSRPPDVAVTANTAAQVFSGNTSVAHFYYEHPTAVVQLAQTPQPTAAVQTDNGKRSQATSPVNPAETSLTPPPEVASVQLDSEDGSNNVSVAATCGSGEGSAVQVQDASNQTDTPPVSEDETGDTNSTSMVSSCIQASKSSNATDTFASPQTPISLPVAVVTTTALTSSITTAVIATTNAEDHITPPIPESARDLKPPSAETILPIITKSPTQNQVVDVSGLELLSNSIEQFESHCSLSDSEKQSDKVVEQSLDSVNSQVVNGLLTLGGTPVETFTSCEQIKPKQEIDLRPADEKAAETLQMLCQQANHIKVEPVQKNEEAENCDKIVNSSKNETTDTPVPTESKQHVASPARETGLCNNTSSNNMLGGLGLLCALAEQRIMEEGGGNNNVQSPHINLDNVVKGSSEIKNSIDNESNLSTTSVDVNRNYKTRKSERECKKFIANKVMQYFHQNGNRSGSSSPQHSGAHSLCTSPSSAEIMDAMELDMRMRLAELQRKYREKQRELSKLTPKKTSSSESSGGITNDTAGTVLTSPTKRGPGRPRKKCNKLTLESPMPSPSVPSAVNGQSKPRVGRPPVLKGKDVSVNKELPPPVLEKVTDSRPRSRFDSEDCAAPKLKASKLDILKPPTLTANKISSYSKLKPATLPGNISTKGLKLPQCNVNLVKLTTNHNGNLKMKDSAMKPLCDPTNTKKCSSLLEEARSKLGSVFSSDKTEKHSAFLSCRLPLVHTACHTFGSKPLSCLTHPGDESHSWFKTADKPLGSISQKEQDASSVESSDSSASRKQKLSLDDSLSSSSKKRKVGRPKKYPAGVGFVDATETIVAKKPKTKNSLVGFLLSRSRNTKGSNSMQSSPSSMSSSSSSSSSSTSTPIRTFGQSLDTSYCGDKTKCNKDVNKTNTINGSALLATTFAKTKVIKTDEAGDHKPNKIRPKLKAEAKVKTWTWGEEDDPEGIDWSSGQVVATQGSVKDEWAKKSGKVDKVSTKPTEAPNRTCKRKLSIGESRSNQGCAKVAKKTSSAATVGKTSTSVREKDSHSDQPSAPKKHKRSSSNSSVNQTSTGGTTSEGEDIPLSMYSAKHNTNANTSTVSDSNNSDAKSTNFNSSNINSNNNSNNNSNHSNNHSNINGNSNSSSSSNTNSAASSCVLTQAHLNEDKQRALTVMGGLFYAGTLSAIRAPDVYGITIDGERGNRPHIYSREEILRDAILEVRPTSITSLTPGTRLCAYWSQQYRCLYPGTVAQPTSPDPELDSHFVNVEFDDGDSGRINIDDIRLLPLNYPTLEYDPNPLLTLGKRRRRNSGASCESHSKDRRTSVETPSSSNRNSSTKNGSPSSKQGINSETGEKTRTESDNAKETCKSSSLAKKSQDSNASSKVLQSDGTKKSESGDGLGKPENMDRTNKERRRLKKRRKEKLKKLLSSAGSLAPDAVLKKRRKKHRCYEEHCKHKKHHKRHRKHKHRHGSRNKDSSSGSSGESSSKSGHGRSDALTRLSPVLEQLDILEIQQTALRQLTSGDSNSKSCTTTTVSKVDITSSSGTSGSTGSEDEEEPDISSTASPEGTVAEPSTKATPEVQATVSTPTETKRASPEVPSDTTGDPAPDNSLSNTTQDNTSSKTDAGATPPTTANQDASSAAGKKAKKDKETGKPKKHRDRQPSVENRSKIAAFLPARQLWGWSGRGFKRPGAKGRGKKEFYKAIQRGKETIMVGDCAVFLSTGRPDRPYIGRIESMWEAWGTNMVVRVKWFYHPEETNGCTVQLKYPGALFESPHVDENDVQTISHKCEVLPLDGYTGRLGTEPERYSSIYDNNDIYYLAGYYDPTTSQLSMKPGVV